jgi:CRISPR-associated protein Cas2
MVVMVMERVPRSLRGELTRWLLEVQTGVFVGSVNATVRELLWKKCVARSAGGRVCQLWSTNTEQRFAGRCTGEESRHLTDFDGLLLVEVRNAEWERKRRDPKREAGL